jgi:hypothetical protein
MGSSTVERKGSQQREMQKSAQICQDVSVEAARPQEIPLEALSLILPNSVHRSLYWVESQAARVAGWENCVACGTGPRHQASGMSGKENQQFC